MDRGKEHYALQQEYSTCRIAFIHAWITHVALSSTTTDSSTRVPSHSTFAAVTTFSVEALAVHEGRLITSNSRPHLTKVLPVKKNRLGARDGDRKR